jgi:hypothetical protein
LDLTGAGTGLTNKTYAIDTGFVYILRDKTTGEILKVGKTKGGVSIKNRFNMYRRKSQEYGYRIEADY